MVNQLPILTVVGATGSQGGGVLSAFLADPQPKYHIRALTSNPSSPAAVALASKVNVSVVQVDINSEDSVAAAFAGSTAIFANTHINLKVLFSQDAVAAQELEAQQGLNLVRAAARTEGLEHLVLSTLPDALRLSGGKFDIPHFQSKVPAERFARSPESGLADKTTFMNVGMYSSNLARPPYSPVFMDGAKSYVFTLPCDPDVPFPLTGDETVNIGIFAKAIFSQPDKTLGRTAIAAAETMSCRDWAAALQDAMRRQGRDSARVTFLECSLPSFMELWGPAGAEIGKMYRYISEVGMEDALGDTGPLGVLRAEDLGVQGLMRSTVDRLGDIEWK